MSDRDLSNAAKFVEDLKITFHFDPRAADADVWPRRICARENFWTLWERGHDRTPLHIAAEQGLLREVQWLVEKAGVDPNELEHYGRTALHHACHAGQIDVVKWLEPRTKGSLGRRTGERNHALHIACMSGSLPLVKWTLTKRFGLTVHDRGWNNCTPLHFAALTDNVEVVRYLVVERGAEVNCVDGSGNSPLHHACSSDRLGVVQWLVTETEVCLDASNFHSVTPLDRAHGASRNWLSRNIQMQRVSRAQAALSSLPVPAACGMADSHSAVRGSSGNTDDIVDGEQRLAQASYSTAAGAVVTPGPTLGVRFGPGTAPAAQVARAKLLLLGPCDAGKSTLADSLAKIKHHKKRTSRRESNRDATMGIEVRVVTINGKEFALYDFAGHPEFYVTHELVLADNRGVFIIVGNLEEPTEQRRRHVDFWAKFLASALPRAEDGSLPQVLLVLSHRGRAHRGYRDAMADGQGVWRSCWGADVLEQYTELFKGKLAFLPDPFVLDCQLHDDAAMQALRSQLSGLHTHVCETAPPVPEIVKYMVPQLRQLRLEHATWPIVSKDIVLTWLQASCPDASSGSCLVEACLTYLESLGEVVHLEKANMVALSPQFLTKDVLGKVLARMDMPNSMQATVCSAQQGYVTVQQLEKAFEQGEAREVATLMCELSVACNKDTFLLVPSLLPRILPPWGSIWHPPLHCQVHGRRLRPDSPVTLFSPGLFPRVQATCLSGLDGESQVWFNGFKIHFVNGMVLVAAMASSRQMVDVVSWCQMRHADVALTACRKAVQDVIAKVIETASHSCSGTDVVEEVLSPSQLSLPPNEAFRGPRPGVGVGASASTRPRPRENDNTSPAAAELAFAEGHGGSAAADAPLHGIASYPVDRLCEMPPAERVTNPDTHTNDIVSHALGLPTLVLLIVRCNASPYRQGLNVDKEEAVIRQALALHPRALVCVETLGFPTLQALRHMLCRVRPDWIHFSGHGNPRSKPGLRFVDRNDRDIVVSPKEFSSLLQHQLELTPPAPVTGVVLNCCYALPVMHAVKPFVEAVIGIDGDTITDACCHRFAEKFWDTMFRGRTARHSLGLADKASQPREGDRQRPVFQYILLTPTTCEAAAACAPMASVATASSATASLPVDLVEHTAVTLWPVSPPAGDDGTEAMRGVSMPVVHAGSGQKRRAVAAGVKKGGKRFKRHSSGASGSLPATPKQGRKRPGSLSWQRYNQSKPHHQEDDQLHRCHSRPSSPRPRKQANPKRRRSSNVVHAEHRPANQRSKPTTKTH
eukprot:m.173226 g.173226  ORF g.173226 m.173226 type:complete len:1267 (-) comp17867_c1_seq2:3026-6826(-)